MTRTSASRVVLPLLLAGLAACDLPELSEGQRADAGAAADAPVVDEIDASEPPEPADASGPDAFDDPSIPPGSVLGSCDPKTWVASASISHPVNPPAYAIDGLLPTRWSSGAAQSPNMTFDIDLGGFVMVDRVTILPFYENDGVGDYPRGLNVRVSYDGVDYSRVLRSIQFPTDPGTAVVDFAPHAARYLRLELTQGIGSWWTIHDLSVGCSGGNAGSPDAGVPQQDAGIPGGTPNPNKAGWTATANFTNPGDDPARAFDGIDSTRWASGKSPEYGDETFKLDLGVVTSVSQVWLSSQTGDYPAAWVLDVSSDDVSYTNVAHGLGTDLTQMVFPTTQARYLMVRQIGSGWNHWWGINEITVYP